MSASNRGGRGSRGSRGGNDTKGGKPPRGGKDAKGEKAPRGGKPTAGPGGSRPAPKGIPHRKPAGPRHAQSHAPPPQDLPGEDDWEGRVWNLAESPADESDEDGDTVVLQEGGLAGGMEPDAPLRHTESDGTQEGSSPEGGDLSTRGADDDDADWEDDVEWEVGDAFGDVERLELDPAEEGEEPLRAGPRVRRPLIALVGRPNVGKSRLFNRMTGTRHAIVEDMPGVTRDRQYGTGSWEGRAYQVVDTGGFEPDTSDILLSQMKEQAHIAMAEAEIIVFVMDGQSGLMPADREIAQLLRRSDRIVIPVVNKIDGDRHEALVGEFHALGLPGLEWISAEHGRNYDGLLDRIKPHLPRIADVERTERDEIAIAVIGRPNAGKSTLINRLLGEERLLTSDIPGTTRDAVNTHIEVEGQSLLFIDTAGVRRKRSIHEAVEKYSVVQAFKAIDRADVVLHVLDGSVDDFGVSTQDKRIAGMAHEKGRACILLLNKWDAVEKDHRTADQRVQDLRDTLRFNRYAPVVTISALTGQRVHRILPLVKQIHAQYTRRVSTSELNRVLREALERNPPPTKGRRRLKVFYASQVATSPPTLMLVVNSKDLIHFSYERYLRNCLRQAFAFEGTPIKVFYRERAQRRGEREPEGLDS